MSSCWKRLVKSFIFQSESRGSWQGRLDFLMAAIGYSTSIGVIVRFPFLVFRNGGAMFFIPFFFFMVVLGLPLVFLEISLGQFTSSGALTCWKFMPIFQGTGAAMVVLSSLGAVYYSAIVDISFYYLFASFTSQLPWARCDNQWNTKECVQILADASQCGDLGLSPELDGGCYDDNYDIRAIWNQTGDAAGQYSYLTARASEDYLTHHVLRSGLSTGVDDLGPVVWHLALCSLLTWGLTAVILSRGVNIYGKVSWFTTLCPLVVLLVMFIFGLTLEGHAIGYKYFAYPSRRKLDEYWTWSDAAMQVFYSLGVSFGGLITLASYNRFNTDTYRDSILICLANTVTSLLSGFTVFFFLGALATRLNVSVSGVAGSGLTALFSVMPSFFVTTSAPPFWAILWFLGIVCLLLGPHLGSVETVVTALLDVFPKLRRYRLFVVLAVCAAFFLLSLPFITQGGSHLFAWVDTTTLTWNLLVIPVIELIAILMYGVLRFLNDIEVMTGGRILGCLPTIVGKLWMGFYLYFPALAALGFIYFAKIIAGFWSPEYPAWATRLGAAIRWSTPACVICGAILAIVMSLVRNCRRNQRDWFEFVTPTRDWGPAKVEHRVPVQRYVPWFTVNPWPANQDQGEDTALQSV